MKNEEEKGTKRKNVVALWESTVREYQPLLDEMEEDFKFRLGDQWDDGDKAQLHKDGRPVLSLNTCKKACDIITGYQRQNFADIRVLPIENSDADRAEIYSELVKWIMARGTNKMHCTFAFDDAVTCGLGWITAEMKYDKDMVNGDIVIGHASPFSILPDPMFKEPDLSDAKYVLRYSWLSKDEIEMLYPESNLSEVQETEPNEEYTQQPKAHGVKKVLIIEKWYRAYVKRTILIDTETEEIVEIGGEMTEEAARAAHPMGRILTRKVPTVKLITVAGDGTVLYDGDHPHGTDSYPFFPVFGYFTPSFNELDLRHQGMIRILKDPQREKNKRRSQSMYAVMSLPLAGYMIEKGAVDSMESFTVTKGGMKVIEYNPGKAIKQIQAPDLPSALVQLESMSDQDMKQIGPNPDLLGEQMSRSEPGINIQLRQKQGMSAIQEFFDNLSFAKKTMGVYILDLIRENFTDLKVARILGRDVEEGFVEAGADIEFDCVVDEVAESPTYRMGVFTTLAGLKSQGMNVPDELLYELADMPKAMKETILEPLREQRKLMNLQIKAQIQQIEQAQAQAEQQAQATAQSQQQAAAQQESMAEIVQENPELAAQAAAEAQAVQAQQQGMIPGQSAV